MILSEPAVTVDPALSEHELLVRARAGDRRAQAQLAQEYRRPMYFLALQLLGNPDDAMDVVQDSLVRFLTNLHRFDESRPLRPWLFQIVRNRVIDLMRRRKVRKHDSIDARDDEGNPQVQLLDPTVDPHRDAKQSQLRVHLWQALESLSPAQREILVLRDYQDLSYAEIAETLKIPIGTVMSRLHGARIRLKQIVEDDLLALTH